MISRSQTQVWVYGYRCKHIWGRGITGIGVYGNMGIGVYVYRGIRVYGYGSLFEVNRISYCIYVSIYLYITHLYLYTSL
jgi:hypothetical protein